MKKTLIRALIVLVIAFLWLISIAMAYTKSTNINVIFEGFRINIDGVEYVDIIPFRYNGTTYVPLRMIVEALGKNVVFDENKKLIKIVKKPNGKFLSDIKPLFKDRELVVNKKITYKNETYYKTLYGACLGDEWYTSVKFSLNKKYESLSAFFACGSKSPDVVSHIRIVGDNGEILWVGELKSQQLPEFFEIGVDGVDTVTITGNNSFLMLNPKIHP